MTLETILRQKGISFEKSRHPRAYTAQRLAHEEHVSGYNVAKPVIVKGDLGYAMCVIPACAKLDLIKVAEVLQEFDVRLATEAEMRDLFLECELGAEPPIGRIFGMKMITDDSIKEDEFLVMQNGTHTEAVKVNRKDWERLAEPIFRDITLKPAV